MFAQKANNFIFDLLYFLINILCTKEIISGMFAQFLKYKSYLKP